MRDILADLVIAMPIPGWTAHIGQHWDTYDVAPFNLYNVLWVAQNKALKLLLR